MNFIDMNNIDELAGRKLDALVAGVIFGLEHAGVYRRVRFRLENGRTDRGEDWYNEWMGEKYPWKGWQIAEELGEEIWGYWGYGEVARLPQYGSDMAAAWEVHCDMCGRLFSTRQQYLEGLQRYAWIKTDLSVAWPDVLVVLRDEMATAICRSALRAVS